MQALPSREQATAILRSNNCPDKVIRHCLDVADFAIKIATKVRNRGYPVDVELVEAGAVLHDLGRARSQGTDHSLVGAQMANELGLPQSVVNIIKRHVGAGITREEAQQMGWPEGVYEPQTLEEKIVGYADKRLDHGKVIPIENEIEKLQKKGLAEGAERVRRLHDEITGLLGE